MLGCIGSVALPEKVLLEQIAVSTGITGKESPHFACAAPRPSISSDFRCELHASSIAVVENLSIAGFPRPFSGYEPVHQVALPYFGLFAYSVGRKKWLIDSNRTLFISPGWEFHEEHPVAGLGHAAILINPTREIIEELCGAPGPDKNSAFLSGAVQAKLRLRLLIQWMLSQSSAEADPLQKDEWVVRALELAIGGRPSRPRPCSRTVERAKEFLHARGCDRVSLTQIASSVDVSPIYLTQEFTRSEGMPLYRYQLALRLGRALLELSECDSITGLALDLGFSSHSHFAYAFRNAFGMTPSKYRASARSPGELAAAAHIFDRINGRRRRAA